MLCGELQREYGARFEQAGIDLVIGRAGWLTSRGTSVEINGEWYWFKAARWSLLKRRWVVIRSIAELEADVRDFLDKTLIAKSR